MGHYTEFRLDIELDKDMPFEIVTFLEQQCSDSNAVEISEKQKCFHPFFETERASYIGTGGSGYFEAKPRLVFNKTAEDNYLLNIICNFKNHDNEIEKFIDMISSWNLTTGVVGHIKYQETWDNGIDDVALPKLIIEEEGVLRTINILRIP